MSRFPYQTDYDFGYSLGSTPIQRRGSLQENVDEHDVYEFDISGTRNINLSLNNISAGDDADLYLYRDNGNGYLDAGDALVRSSVRGGNRDDSINVRASGGTYFARVNYFSGGSDGRITYDLDLSATSTGTASNVIAVEEDLGNLSRDVTRSGWVGNTDTTDTYQFSLGYYEGVNISLSGLSSDADIRLVRDRDGDSVVDSNEVISTSTRGGTLNELISGINNHGTYQLQVYQYSGNTNYQVRFDHYNTSYPLV